MRFKINDKFVVHCKEGSVGFKVLDHIDLDDSYLLRREDGFLGWFGLDDLETPDCRIEKVDD